LGTAEIVRRALIEPSKKIENISVLGIASRDINKAKLFSSKYGIKYSFGSYNELLKCDEINTVYIPLITGLHAEWTIKAIDAGKHVLVEKPICLNVQDYMAIDNALSENKVCVVEAMMAMYHPWQDKMQSIIRDGTYGKLRSINTRSCYRLKDLNDFRLYPEKGGSVFFEEGVLWCQITQKYFGLNPLSFDSHCDFNGPFGGDHQFEAHLRFPDNVESCLYCSYDDPYEANHWFEFDHATLLVKNFWRPTFGFVNLKIEIQPNLFRKEYIVFKQQNYFYNQLVSFYKNYNNVLENRFLNESFERIRLMEHIYKVAK
jgi:predicted dehydrogenase